MPKILKAHNNISPRKPASATAEFPRDHRNFRASELSTGDFGCGVSAPGDPDAEGVRFWGTRISGTCELTKIRLTGECEQEVTVQQNQMHTGGGKLRASGNLIG